jgi:hypothetical protein
LTLRRIGCNYIGIMADDQIDMLGPEDVVSELRAIRRRMPETGLMPRVARAMHRVAHTNPDFVVEAINSVGASPSVQGALGKTSEELRRETSEASRWTAVEIELKVMLKFVSDTNLVRRHRIGLTALQVYSICQQLVRQEQHSDLLSYVERMRQLNRFGRKRKVHAEPETTPAAETTTPKPPEG